MEKTKEIELVAQKAANATVSAAKLTVADKEGFTQAGEFLVNLKKLSKAIKEQKEKVTKPLNQALAAYREMFRPIENDLNAAEYAIKTRMANYLKHENERARQEAQEVESKLEKGKINPATAISRLEKIETVSPSDGGVVMKMQKVVKVVDESQVPKEYWIIDEVKLRRDALGNKSQGIEPKEIPGVEIVEEEVIAV